MSRILLEGITIDELRELLREDIRAELATLTPAKPEPDPNRLWSSYEIAEASGLSQNTVAMKLKKLEKERFVTLQKKGAYTAIPFKNIKELKLRNFNPTALISS